MRKTSSLTCTVWLLCCSRSASGNLLATCTSRNTVWPTSSSDLRSSGLRSWHPDVGQRTCGLCRSVFKQQMPATLEVSPPRVSTTGSSHSFKDAACLTVRQKTCWMPQRLLPILRNCLRLADHCRLPLYRYHHALHNSNQKQHLWKELSRSPVQHPAASRVCPRFPAWLA